MGRKGGGRAGFMKAARRGPEEASDEDQPAAPPPPKETPKEQPSKETPKEPSKHAESAPVISKKAAAFLIGSGDGGSDDNDDDDTNQERSASGETRGQMVQRHKREAKALKEQIKRMGKKSKEGAKLEAEMKVRHETELASLSFVSSSSGGDGGGSATQDKDTNNEEEDDVLANALAETSMGGSGGEGGGRVKKPTKAQRRRQQKAERDAEREARIAQETSELGETERMLEEKALKKVLAPLGLAVKDIPPDGHCLYRSLEDQLTCVLSDGGASALLRAAKYTNDDDDNEDGDDNTTTAPTTLSFLTLRHIAAQYMRENADHFRHFVADGDASGGDASGDAGEAFEEYCAQVETTAAWGGHVEIEALSRALQLPIRVYSVGMAPVEVGFDLIGEEKEEGSGHVLQLCYVRHAYGLGEHYNSVMKRERRVTFEDDDDDDE